MRSSRKKRTYASSLRQDQRQATRTRILDGIFSMGSEALSIPALARHTGVSVPTIYRHFPTRVDLLRAMAEHAGASVKRREVPFDFDHPGPALRAFFETRFQIEDRLGPAAHGQAAWEIRRAVTVPKRRAAVPALIDHWAPTLGEPDRARLTDILTILLSAHTAAGFRHYLGHSSRQAADCMEWMLEALAEHAKRRATRPKEKRR